MTKVVYIFLCLFLLSLTSVFSQTPKTEKPVVLKPVLKRDNSYEVSTTKKKPDDDYTLKMGDENFSLFKFKEAVDYYLEAYTGNNERKFYLTQQIAKSYRALIDYKNALDWYAKAYEFKTDNSAENIYEYAHLLKNDMQYDKAIEVYKQYCKKINKDDSYAELFAANCLWAKQNINQKSRFGVYPTNIETGGKHMGMDIYNAGLIISSPVNKNFDEKTVYYNLSYAKKIDSVSFGKAEDITGEVRSVYYEAGPSITEDGKTLYYTKNSSESSLYNPKKTGKYNITKNGNANLQIYRSINNNGSWTKGIPLNCNSLEYNCVFPCASPDGKTLYFCSNMASSLGGYDIYKAAIINDTILGPPENLGPEINTVEDELYPAIKKNYFYFSSKGKNGFGGLDIQQGEIIDGKIKNVKNLGIPFNSSKDDFSILFSENGKEGYFASNRAGEHGGDKVYYFKRLRVYDTIRGTVIDQITSHVLEGVRVDLYEVDDKGNKTLVQSTNADNNGKWEFIVDAEKTYSIAFNTPNYDGKDFILPPTESKIKPSRKEIVAKLNPLSLYPSVKKNNVVKIDNIYFDSGKATINPDSYSILDNICNFLKEKPEANIELSAHTDAVGNDASNLKLSEKRALSCYEYLISKGIDAKRLVPKGYGETKLLNNCNDGKKCSEAENKINRRVEVKFL